MAFPDPVPSGQENRLPVPVSAERHDSDTHPLLSLLGEVNRLFDDVFSAIGVPAFAGFNRPAGVALIRRHAAKRRPRSLSRREPLRVCLAI